MTPGEPLRVYVASMYERRQEMEEVVAPAVRSAGHIVTSRWHKTHQGTPSEQAAREDIEDIDASDVVLVRLEERGVYGTGGRHFEQGYAYGMGKKIWSWGAPKEHVFQKGLNAYTHFDTLEDVLAFLPMIAKSQWHCSPSCLEPEHHLYVQLPTQSSLE